MKTNFIIKDFREIEWNNIYFDIHNNFEFISKDRNGNNIITLKFQKSTGLWVKPDEFNELVFINKNISFYYEESGESTYEKEKRILGEITFFPSVEREINNSFIDQELPKEDDDIIYTFEDGSIIRISCEEIEFIAR